MFNLLSFHLRSKKTIIRIIDMKNIFVISSFCLSEMMEIELDNPERKAIKIESNEDNLSDDNSDDVTQRGDDVNDVSDHFDDVSDFGDDADNFSENEDYDNFDDTNNTSKPHLQCEKQLNEIKSSLGLTKNDFDAYNKRINSEKDAVKISPAVTSRYGVKRRPPPEVVVFTPHQKKEVSLRVPLFIYSIN